MMGSILNNFIRRENPAELICVSAYAPDERIFFLSDGYLGAALDVTPCVGIAEEVAEKISTILRVDLPPGSFISFLLYSSPDITMHTQSIVNLRRQAGATKGSLFLDSKEMEAQFYEDGVDTAIEPVNDTRTRDFRCIVSVKIPCSASGIPSEADMKVAADFKGRLLRGLESIGMYGNAMSAAAYIQFLGTIINRSKSASWRKHPDTLYDDEKLINEQIFDLNTDISVSEKGFKLGETHVRALSSKKLPKMFTIGAVPAYIADVCTGSRGIRGPFLICVNIFYPDAHKEKTNLEQRRQYINYQAFGPLLKFIPKIGYQKESFDTLFSAIDAGDRVIRMCQSFFLFDENEAEVSRAAVNMATYYSELGLQMQEDRYIALPLFINALPLCADAEAVSFLGRYNTLTTKHAAHFVPIAADWKGTGTHAMTFVSRTGQLQGVDLFDSQTNFNAVVAAASGSGKSFLTNYLTVSYRGLGARIWIIDVGRSYLKLCQQLDGQFIEFSPDSKICLNPFPLIKDYGDEEDTIIGLLAAMACPGDDVLDSYQISRVKEYVKTGWLLLGTSMTIDDIAESLKQDADERVRDIGHRLFAFTSAGEYGRYFVGENNVDISNPFTVLELEELKSKPHLQGVVLLQLIYQIQQEMYLGDLDQRKVFVVDEAWDLLKHERIANFIEGGYRRFRKYGGSAIVVTQSLFDLYKERAGIAIAENSSNLFLLGQKRDVITKIQQEKKLDLTPGGFEVLKTVASVKGKYSEVFFYMDNGTQMGIGRLIVDRFTQLLYTTMASEVSAIRKRMEAGMTLTEAIHDVIAWEQAQKGVRRD